MLPDFNNFSARILFNHLLLDCVFSVTLLYKEAETTGWEKVIFICWSAEPEEENAWISVFTTEIILSALGIILPPKNRHIQFACAGWCCQRHNAFYNIGQFLATFFAEDCYCGQAVW